MLSSARLESFARSRAIFKMPCPDGNTVLDWVEHRLTTDAAADIEAHFGFCADCRRIVSELFRQGDEDEGARAEAPQAIQPQAIGRGKSVGRYLILSPIGAGAMGVVYSAHDPELDRKIAIKLLRPDAALGERAAWNHVRLLREAQVMARVSHSNVVPVYDVGTVGDQVFVAMEFIEGTNLRLWLHEERRSWQAVLTKFVQAGEGLIAAHAAGVIHRDFKPDNVLIGRDDRVCVSDFGLARSFLETPVSRPDLGATSKAASRPSAAPFRLFTTTGLVLGTPAYMAPEQLLGQEATARSDQFSFCVALYEALYGERPFAGDDIEAISAAIVRGQVREASGGSRVPGWIRRALLRGLSALPGDRYPSMDALLTVLRRDSARRRRHFLTVTSLIGLAAAGLLFFAGARQRQRLLCSGAPSKLASIWDDSKKTASRQAFLATGKPYAADAWTGLAMALDRYAGRWMSMHREACEATRIRGEQSESLLDLRMQCLDDRLYELRALVRMLEQADDQLVRKAADTTRSLQDLDTCADAQSLRSREGSPPSARANAKDLEAGRTALAEARTLYSAGKYSQSIRAGEQAAKTAHDLGHRSLEGLALMSVGKAQGDAGDTKAAELTLQKSAGLLEASGDDEDAATAIARLAIVIGGASGRRDQAQQWIRFANSMVERTGHHSQLEATVRNVEGTLLIQQGKYQEALGPLERALALSEKSDPKAPDDASVATVLTNLSTAYRNLARYPDALHAQERALAIEERLFGREHPRISISVNNLASVSLMQGNYEAAAAGYRRSLALDTKVLGESHPNVGVDEINLAGALVMMKRLDDALSHAERSLRIYEAAEGTEHQHFGQALQTVGQILKLQKRFDEAEQKTEQGLAILERIHGNEHPLVGYAQANLGEILLCKKRYREALEAYQRALVIREKALGAKHPLLANPLTGIGRANILLGHARQALEPLERALAIEMANNTPIEHLATTRFALARALWKTDSDHGRSTELALAARDGFAKNAAAKDELNEVETWIDAHGKARHGSQRTLTRPEKSFTAPNSATFTD